MNVDDLRNGLRLPTCNISGGGRAPLTTVVALLLGCTSADPPPAVHADSAGVAIIFNTGTDRNLTWTYRVIATLGGEAEGPEAFYQVRRSLVASDSLGDVYVLDPANQRVSKFRVDGSVEYTVGRPGDGPGEFRRPTGISTSRAGELTVLDARRARFIKFDRGGEFVSESATVSSRTRAPISQFLIISDAVVRHEQEYLPDGYRQSLVRIGSRDTIELSATPIAATRAVVLNGCGTASTRVGPVIFTPQLAWHGNAVWIAVAEGPGYVVHIFDAEGSLRRSIRREIPLEEASAPAAARWAEDFPFTVATDRGPCTIPAEEIVEKVGVAQFLPVVVGVAVAPDGTLWVQRSRWGTHSGQIDIFTPAGEYDGTLSREFPFPLEFLPDGKIIFAERGASDIERLAIADVVTNEAHGASN